MLVWPDDLIEELGVTKECCLLWSWLPRWGTSITMRHHSASEWFVTSSGSTRGFSQRNWQLRLGASGAGMWRNLSCMPSFAVRSCSCCGSFSKVLWFVYFMGSSLSWKSVLCVVIWFRRKIRRNVIFFSTYLALWESGFEQRDRRDFTMASPSYLRWGWLFTSNRLKSNISLRDKGSLRWNSAKGEWKLHFCVEWKRLTLNFY